MTGHAARHHGAHSHCLLRRPLLARLGYLFRGCLSPNPDVAPVAWRALRRLIDELPLRLDLDLFCNLKGVVDVDPEIPDSALNLGVTEQEVDSPEIAGSSVDHRRFGPPEGMGAPGDGIQADRRGLRAPQARDQDHGGSDPLTRASKRAGFCRT